MADLNTRERLQPSLLDRLTDVAPDTKRETFEQQTLGWQQLRQAVLRDLAWLLNTTNLAALEDLDTTPLAAASTVNYGIPGFAGLVGTTDRMATLETGIAAAIRTFEPRIRPDTLAVRVRETTEDKPTPAILFEIERRTLGPAGAAAAVPGDGDRAGNRGSPRSPMRGRLADGPAPAAPL